MRNKYMGFIPIKLERSICKDYQARTATTWKYGLLEVADKNEVSESTVSKVAKRNGLNRYGTRNVPRRERTMQIDKKAFFACPICGSRSSEREGHELCQNREAA